MLTFAVVLNLELDLTHLLNFVLSYRGLALCSNRDKSLLLFGQVSAHLNLSLGVLKLS